MSSEKVGLGPSEVLEMQGSQMHCPLPWVFSVPEDVFQLA